MNSKFRRSKMKISGLFYDNIPALYWNDKGNQINLEWCIGSSAICRRITGWFFPKFRARYWSWPSKIKPGFCLEISWTNYPGTRTTEESIPHPHRCLGLNTRKNILVRTSSSSTPKLSQESRLHYLETGQPPTTKRYSLFLLWCFRYYNITS